MGSETQRQHVRRCYLDGRVYSTDGEPPTIRVLKAWEKHLDPNQGILLLIFTSTLLSGVELTIVPTHCAIGVSIQPRCTCGQGSAREGVQEYVFLME